MPTGETRIIDIIAVAEQSEALSGADNSPIIGTDTQAEQCRRAVCGGARSALQQKEHVP